ncbi:unnamed protein product [Rodentolepis nana]|uniref:Uncharacterized protein n=1 Tax=Rodentolepis nana TaxID=102285 RepID=A0A0R3TP21_RODNA|nr:unnamed protein product [Rodentolepis nana]
MPHEEDETKRYNFRSEGDEEWDGLNRNYWRVYSIFADWDETEECRVRGATTHTHSYLSLSLSRQHVSICRPRFYECVVIHAAFPSTISPPPLPVRRVSFFSPPFRSYPFRLSAFPYLYS